MLACKKNRKHIVNKSRNILLLLNTVGVCVSFHSFLAFTGGQSPSQGRATADPQLRAALEGQAGGKA